MTTAANTEAPGAMSIHDCEAYAKEHGFDSARFTALFPVGPKQCKWLDAYFGAFMIDGEDGFMTVSDVAKTFPGLICVPHASEAA